MTSEAVRVELGSSLARASALLGEPLAVVGLADGEPDAIRLTAATLADLADPALERGLARAGAQTGVADRRVLASYLESWYAYYVLAPALAVHLVERRVIDLRSDRTALWWGGEGPARLGVSAEGVIVLPDDPLAGSAGVIVAADRDRQRAALHDRIVGHMRPVIDAFHARARLGVRHAWLQVSDRVAGIDQWIGSLIGDEAAGVAEAEQLLAIADGDLRSPRCRFDWYPGPQGSRALQHRGTCCLAWRIAGGAYCPTCPSIEPERRETLIADWLAATVG